jgi:hypothetical protein
VLPARKPGKQYRVSNPVPFSQREKLFPELMDMITTDGGVTRAQVLEKLERGMDINGKSVSVEEYLIIQYLRFIVLSVNCSNICRNCCS